MNIVLSAAQRSLQQEIREYMVSLMTDAMHSEMQNPEYFEGGGPDAGGLLDVEMRWISVGILREHPQHATVWLE